MKPISTEDVYMCFNSNIYIYIYIIEYGQIHELTSFQQGLNSWISKYLQEFKIFKFNSIESTFYMYNLI